MNIQIGDTIYTKAMHHEGRPARVLERGTTGSYYVQFESGSTLWLFPREVIPYIDHLEAEYAKLEAEMNHIQNRKKKLLDKIINERVTKKIGG